VADFPYGVGLVTKTSDYRGSANFDNGASLQASTLYADDPDTIRQLIADVMPHILRIAKRALIFCGSKMLMHYPEPAAIGAVYIPNGAGRCSWGFQCSQPILYYGKDPYMAAGMGARSNSFRTEQPNLEKIDHPCPKPVKWMTWAVTRATLPGETVLDPFMGSGTTGVACVNLGDRNFVGVEKVPAYFAIAQRRIEQAQAQLTLPLFAQAAPSPCGTGD
jgi:hypothetical protein